MVSSSFQEGAGGLLLLMFRRTREIDPPPCTLLQLYGQAGDKGSESAWGGTSAGPSLSARPGDLGVRLLLSGSFDYTKSSTRCSRFMIPVGTSSLPRERCGSKGGLRPSELRLNSLSDRRGGGFLFFRFSFCFPFEVKFLLKFEVKLILH